MKALKTTSLILSLIFLFGLNINARNIEGSGNISKEQHSVKKFTKIDIGGAFEVEMRHGNECSLIVEADDNVHNYITSSVSNKTLTVKLSNSKVDRTNKLRLIITMPYLEEIKASGATNISAYNFTCNSLSLIVSDGAELDIYTNAKQIKGHILGISSVKLRGEANKMDISISGASTLHATDLKCKNGELQIIGAAEANVNICDNLKTDIQGAAKLNNISDCTCKHISMKE